MMWHDDSWGWAGWLGAGLIMLVLWTALAVLVVVVVRRLGGQRSGDAPRDTGAGDPSPARRILDERFARGELSEQDYLRQRDVLSSR